MQRYSYVTETQLLKKNKKNTECIFCKCYEQWWKKEKVKSKSTY